MTIIVYFGVVLANYAYYTRYKKKRDNVILLACSIILLGIIFSYGINTTDMIYYKPYYDTVFSRSFKATEIGFYAIVYLSNLFNIGYVGLRAIIFCIAQIFLWYGLKKICINKHLFVVFYCLFLFYIDDIQLRNYLTLCVLVLAFSFLLDDTDEYAIIKYIGFIILGATFHTSAIFYLVFIFIKLPYRKLWLNLLTIGIFLLEIFIVINGRRVPLIGSIATLVLGNDTQRLTQYFASTTNGSIMIVFLIILNILLAFLTYYECKHSKCSSLSIHISKVVFYCSILQLIWLPMLWLSVEFYRFPRNMLALHYIALTNYLVQRRKLTKGKLIIIIMYITNLAAWLYVAYYRVSDWNTIFYPIFYQNGLFN